MIGLEHKLRQARADELEVMQPKRAELDNVNALIKQAESEADDIARAMKKAKG